MKKQLKRSFYLLTILIFLISLIPLGVYANPVDNPPPPDTSSIQVYLDDGTTGDDGTSQDDENAGEDDATQDDESNGEDDTTPEDITDPVLPTCQYCTHLEGTGWQGWVPDNELSGTVGESRRLEAFGVVINDCDYDLGIEYQSFVENYGWLGLRTNGEGSGTSGYGLRLEALHINLTGDDADKFDIYYQVHAENYGWLDWAKNGENAGTTGLGLRLEAIRIVIQPAGTEIPGKIGTPYIEG